MEDTANLIKPHKKRISKRKQLMVEALTTELGIVTSACKIAGISPWTHYEWLKLDKDYKEVVEALEIRKDDLIEKAFLSLVIDRNPSAVIHAVKTKLKHRGYGEDPLITNSNVGYTLEIVRPEKKDVKSI